ncbi:unnamed protein product [Toxocara canis]|uniref:Transposase n=1 Tax=Toxocara canis TaxID=6265 RepID=A0A183UJG6_TOXCA|nr:unnamed protein product [Toxocara canis]
MCYIIMHAKRTHHACDIAWSLHRIFSVQFTLNALGPETTALLDNSALLISDCVCPQLAADGHRAIGNENGAASFVPEVDDEPVVQCKQV